MNREARIQLAVIFATNIALEITFVSGTVAGPAFQRAFGLSDTQLGLVLGAIHIGLVGVALFIGRYTHRYGPPRILSLGLIAAATSAALIIAAAGFVPLFLGLAALGIAAAFITNANATFTSEIAGSAVRRVMALASGLWFASSSVSAPAVGAWLSYGSSIDLGVWSHRLVYVFDIALIAVCFLLVRRIVVPRYAVAASDNAAEPTEAGDGEEGAAVTATAADYRERLNPEWPWIPALGILHGLFVIILLAWTNPMLQAKFGATDAQGGLGVGLVSLGIGGGRFVLASIRSNIDDRFLLAGSGALGGALLVVALLAPTLPLTYVALTISGFACALTFPTIVALVGTRFPRTRSRMFGFMEASISVAGLAGPAAVGLLADSGVPIWHGMLISPAAGAVICAIALGWRLRRR